MAAKKKKSGANSEPESTSAESPGFEVSLASLEKIVAELESGQLTLSDSIQRYEQGVGLLRQCHAALDQVQQKIELLTAVDRAGQPTTRPLDSTGEADENEASGHPPDVDDGARLF